MDDIRVDEDILTNYLTRPWSELCARQGMNVDAAILENEFFSDSVALMKPLVRAELLLREAQLQFAEPDEHEFEHYQEEMETNVGSALEALTKRYGADGWRAHVVRQFQMRKLHELFREYAVVVSDEEVHDYYTNHVMADLPPAAEREQQNLSYEYLEPMLRQKLEKDAVTAAEEKWIDEQLAETSALLKLRDGREVIIY